ncbi:hypothetical protein EST38_g11721 [Candolleomyces aberdarensis]|uniref:Uncharacterized protein n=1 Tax=Candolleomyces aberdarensis TaxID=2316362 RepID=A0A4Q2D459_9AGAR|nr:hypothetical protein EST38_g11721 [Candolleomyces aberdarensis]
MRFLIHESSLIELISCLIVAILVLDSDLKEAILTSTSGVDTILAAWTQRGVGGRYEVVAQPPLCALLILFRDVVSHAHGADVLYDLLITSPPRLKKLVRTLIARVSDIADRYARGQVTTAFALEYLHDLLDIIRKLLHQQHIWTALFKSGELLSTLPSALLIIACGHTDVKVWTDVAGCLRHLVTFCFTGGMGSINPMHQVYTALSGGVLKVVYRCLVNLPPSHPDFSFVLLLLGDFAAYAVYTRVVERFTSAFQKMMAMPNVQTLSEEVLQLTSTITANLSVKIDWNEYHRGECTSESKSNVRRRSLGVSLSVSLRLHLLGYIESFCKSSMPAFEALQEQKHGANVPLHSLVMFADLVSIPPALNVTKIASYKSALDGGLAYGRRTVGFMRQFLQRREIHLAEVLFPYGGCTIRVFARLWKDDDNIFHTLSAIFGLIDSNATEREGKTARQLRDYQAGELGHS